MVVVVVIVFDKGELFGDDLEEEWRDDDEEEEEEEEREPEPEVEEGEDGSRWCR